MTARRQGGIDVERLARALDLCGIGFIDGHLPSTWAATLATEYRAALAFDPEPESRTTIDRNLMAGVVQDHETSGIHGPLHCSLACAAVIADEYERRAALATEPRSQVGGVGEAYIEMQRLHVQLGEEMGAVRDALLFVLKAMQPINGHFSDLPASRVQWVYGVARAALASEPVPE